MRDKFLSFLGICKKSRNLLEGYNKCEAILGKRKIYLFIISEDVSINTLDKFKKLAQDNGIEMINKYSKIELGDALGIDEINVLGITDGNLAKKLIELNQ